ncbi:hypothetical protein [Pseudomonas prosekii]|uniref:Polysaccharide biosynthesis protein n=1 Tax=Pseudomonas prosekii TaxID=1148509 RepID=A0A2U2DDH1_9PSED|nr:hypothetical protein [Pseudomonas prosekii]PWE47446.1 hypothetical protein C9I49_02825 [Pseudomonas prosekii]
MLVLFVVDGISKAFLALASLVLIKYLSISEFAQFSVVFTASMMTYQIIGGIVERLYISDHQNYEKEGVVSSFFLILVFGLAISVYIYFHADISAAILTLILTYLCTKYQIQRIKKQKEERFFIYSFVDMLRNATWLGLLYLKFAVAIELPYIANGFFALGTYALLAIFANSLLYMLSSPEVMKKRSVKLYWSQFISSARYFFSRGDVVLYSILGGAIPYYPFIIATVMRNESLISTYGAAMRYQAIFSMAIMAVNTVVIARFCNRKDIIRAQTSAFYKILPLAMLCLIIAIAFIWWAIPYIDGGKYPGLRTAFVILSSCSAISLVSTVAVNQLLAFNSYRAMFKGVLVGFIVMVVVTPIFNLMSSDLGPLLSMVMGYLVIALLMIWNANKERAVESTVG